MGQNLKNFGVGTSSTLTLVIFGVIFGAIFLFFLYKIYLHLQEQRKWAWLSQMSKEKKLTQNEFKYLKNLAIKNNLNNPDDIYGAMFSLNLPTPLKRKLL